MNFHRINLLTESPGRSDLQIATYCRESKFPSTLVQPFISDTATMVLPHGKSVAMDPVFVGWVEIN